MACNACMTIAPVESDYKAKGTTLEVGDLSIYVAAPPSSSSTAGIIYVPDIFGNTPQGTCLLPSFFPPPHAFTFPLLPLSLPPPKNPKALQICDKVAAAGFWVAFPDVFRGKPWPMEKFPPPDRQELMDWIGGYTFDDKVKPDLAAALEVLRGKGARKFGIVGFCWGGKVSTLASQDASTYSATASAHPSFLTVEDAAVVNAPILLLPSKVRPQSPTRPTTHPTHSPTHPLHPRTRRT